MKKAVLSLGSNMGDSREILRNAVKETDSLPSTAVTAVSKLYETDPWGNTKQNNFLNICIEIETELSPEKLLSALQQIELNAGRTRLVHWGPRTLDIDIIVYENEKRNTESLTLPHPHFKNRMFVLVPMTDIYGNFVALGESFSLIPEEKGQVRLIGEL